MRLEEKIQELLAQTDWSEFEAAAKTKTRLYSRCKVMFSSSHCVLDSKPYPRTPVILDPYGDVVLEPTHWLRSIRVAERSEATARQYAWVLNSFFNFLRKVERGAARGWAWHRVDDKILRLWRNEMEQGVSVRRALKKYTINDKLKVVLRFYVWAQEYGYVSARIGLTPEGGKPYPIRLVRRVVDGIVQVTSDLLYRLARRAANAIPNQDEYDALNIVLSGDTYSRIRDSLMLRWVAGSGLRRGDLIKRVVSELPSRDDCQKLIDADRLYWMQVIGKGSKERAVPVSPHVIVETHDFIEGPRADLILGADVPYYDEIFLSSRRAPLHPQSVSHIFTAGFKQIRKANERTRLYLHRLRARFATLLVQQLAEEDEERGYSPFDPSRQRLILEKAALIMGHEDIKTLRVYLNLWLDRQETAIKRASSKSRGESNLPRRVPA